MEKNLLKTDIKDIGKLFGKKSRNGGKHAYPTKTTLNLGKKPKSINSPSRAIPLFLAIMLLAAGIWKFAVYDRLLTADRADAEALAAETTLADMRAQTADYESVRAEYERHVFPELMVEESLSTDAMDILQLIEQKLMLRAHVRAAGVTEPVINVELSGVTLDELSRIVRSLESSPLVNSVMVYTADSQATPTPEPTPTPKPTRTPKPKRKQTPTPVPATPEPTATPEAIVAVSMTITLKQGGDF